MARRSFLAALLAIVTLWAATARAQDTTAAAHALFDEGKKLVEKGDFAGACPKFRASLDLEVKLGTRLALATCLEKIGRTASAWAEFRDAAATPRADRTVLLAATLVAQTALDLLLDPSTSAAAWREFRGEG